LGKIFQSFLLYLLFLRKDHGVQYAFSTYSNRKNSKLPKNVSKNDDYFTVLSALMCDRQLSGRLHLGGWRWQRNVREFWCKHCGFLHTGSRRNRSPVEYDINIQFHHFQFCFSVFPLRRSTVSLGCRQTADSLLTRPETDNARAINCAASRPANDMSVQYKGCYIQGGLTGSRLRSLDRIWREEIIFLLAVLGLALWP